MSLYQTLTTTPICNMHLDLFSSKKGVTTQQSSRVRNTGFTIASVERRFSPTSCDIKVGQTASRLRVVPIFPQG